VFLTTHYLEEAEALADRVAIVRDGEVVASGTPDGIGGRSRAVGEVRFRLPAGIEGDDLPRGSGGEVRIEAGVLHVPTTALVADLHPLTFRWTRCGAEPANRRM
jgi:ABC-2 type transport system ATP-binding protein